MRRNNSPTRPVAINLIEGSLGEVIAFLDRLSHGENNTPGVAETYAEWQRNIEVITAWLLPLL